jgi:putative hemolysin
VIVLVAAVTISLSVSFLCSLMEACLLSLSNTDIAGFTERAPRIAGIWRSFKSNIQKPIAVILIINTLAHTIGAAISGARFDALYGPKWIWLFSIGYSLFMIQYTEILPKTLGVRFNRRLATISAVPLLAFVKILRPLIAVIQFANRPFEGNTRGERGSVADEISTLARFAVVDRQLSQEQASLITRSIQMSAARVADIMVERDHIVELTDSMNLMQAFEKVHLYRHTRYPLVSDRDPQQVMGYVNFKDLVTALHVAPEDPTLKGIARPILSIPETMPLTVLLPKMIRERQHIAIVRDAATQVVGLVTMEDVIESLVGDIEDEFDRPPAMMVRLGENRWRAGGAVRLAQLRERAFPSLPATEVTIDELVKTQAGGALPRPGVLFHYHGVCIRVRRVARDYVYDVVVEKLATP